MLNKGLEYPNDNSVAQALWTSDHTGFELKKVDSWLTGQFASEARFYERYDAGDFDTAVREAYSWHNDEPFSSRPLTAASYLLGTQGRYTEALEVAQKGLVIDPNDEVLKNNYLYGLMSLGRMDEAERRLVSLLQKKSNTSESKANESLDPHTVANIGMYCYRRGLIEQGEALYRQAIRSYSRMRLGAKEQVANAYVHMAREGALARAPNGEALLDEARKYVRAHPFHSAQFVLAQFEKRSEGDTSMHNRESRVVSGKSLQYDKNTNTLHLDQKKPFKV